MSFYVCFFLNFTLHYLPWFLCIYFLDFSHLLFGVFSFTLWIFSHWLLGLFCIIFWIFFLLQYLIRCWIISLNSPELSTWTLFVFSMPFSFGLVIYPVHFILVLHIQKLKHGLFKIFLWACEDIIFFFPILYDK